MTIEKKIISTNEFKCRGFQGRGFGEQAFENRSPILPEKDAVNVILKIYEDGSTSPLCGFFSNGKCNIKFYSSECPYNKNK